MRSDIIKEGPERAPNRSLLKATGVTDSEMKKAVHRSRQFLE